MTDSTEDLAVLEPNRLSEMTGNDVSLAREVIEIFREQSELWARMLTADLPPRQWADAAHTLKGSALSVGALRLAEHCSGVEALGRRAETETVSLAEIGVALSEVKNEVAAAKEAVAKLDYQLSLSGRFSLS